jgi:hypothetical protein
MIFARVRTQLGYFSTHLRIFFTLPLLPARILRNLTRRTFSETWNKRVPGTPEDHIARTKMELITREAEKHFSISLLLTQGIPRLCIIHTKYRG